MSSANFSPNMVLAAQIAEAGLTQQELADLINAWIDGNTDKPGEVSDRWVRALLCGRILWPRPPQREALEEVFGASAIDLGFFPPHNVRRRRVPKLRVVRGPKGGAVNRRRFFVVVGAGAVALTLPDFTRRSRLGMSDVAALRAPLRELLALDDQFGGSTLAPAAAGIAQHIERSLETCEASAQVSRSLYTVAGEYLGAAGWFAIDADDLPAAAGYLDHALRNASISRDGDLQAHIWNGMAWRARQAGSRAECLAIAQTALASTASRRNPKVAAVWHGWIARGHAWRGNRALAARSISHAHAALDRADATAASATWLTFLDHGEIDSQAAFSHLVLGDFAAAEATASAAIAAAPTTHPRNRISRQLMLAHAYLGQREIERAADIADTVLDNTGNLRSGRLARRYHTLHDRMTMWETEVPAAAAWTQRFRAQLPAS